MPGTAAEFQQIANHTSQIVNRTSQIFLIRQVHTIYLYVVQQFTKPEPAQKDLRLTICDV